MKCKSKNLVIILTLILAVPLLWLQWKAEAYAAAPALNTKEVEIVGEDQTYQLSVKNKAAKCKYKWSSSDLKVARVSSKGLVTAVASGSVTIKCKITYPTKKTKTLACKVTVTIPAQEIKINNASDVNGAHKLLVGEQFDFNTETVPANSSDSTLWTVEGRNTDCIRLDDSAKGIVTGMKTGITTLKVTAVKNSASQDTKNSAVCDLVIIEVVNPSASVLSAEITNSTQIKVVFDSPIDKNTVIGTNNKLSDNISITMNKNAKGVLSTDPGNLTAGLSADGKILTINSSGMFDGEYIINFTDKIKTTGGIAIEECYKKMTFIDTIPPSIMNTDVDDTGMIATISFSEAIDFTNLAVSNATQLVSGSNNTIADKKTLDILNNKSNYIISTDKKSMTINLSKISYADYGKLFSITISGIKDLSGNYPSGYTLTTVVYTDISKKPQAKPLSVFRTGYYTLTATYDRAIQTPGWAKINNGNILYGTVDAYDAKKVNYTISEADASLTGAQTVYLGYWSSYNVDPSDFSSQKYVPFNVLFNIDKTSPVLIGFDFDANTSILTLTYNEEVSLVSNTGIFTSKLVTVTDEIRPGNNLTYTKLDSSDKCVIKLKIGNMTMIGTYTFTIDQGFTVDNYKNNCMSREVTISNSTGTSTELPPPVSIAQSPTNLSQINIEFAQMLDYASAASIANYSIPGVTIIKADVAKNTKDGGATVVLTVADNSIDVTLARPITISGLKGYNGTYGVMSPYTATVELKDNKKPYYVAPPVFDSSAKNIIRLNFSEPIKGTMTVKVTENQVVNGAVYPVVYTNSVTVSGSSVVITLGNIPTNKSYLFIDILDNKITDESGNQAQTMQSQVIAVAAY